VSDIVNRAFLSPYATIERCFTTFSNGNKKSLKSLKECLYYVAGWHAHTINKGSIRRRSDLKILMSTVYSNIVIGKAKASQDHLPIVKVEQVELFGGLKYVSREYFIFILRLEYVFMNLFSTEKLVMIGANLITNVYQELLSTVNVRSAAMSFVSGDSVQADDQDMQDLTIHMTRTYCRMRGKDFVRKHMQGGFKNKNIGKGIRPTLAIISNPEVRKAIGKSHAMNTKETVLSNHNVDTSNNDVYNDQDMHTLMEYTCQILLDDDFINEDDNTLFQEC